LVQTGQTYATLRNNVRYINHNLVHNKLQELNLAQVDIRNMGVGSDVGKEKATLYLSQGSHVDSNIFLRRLVFLIQMFSQLHIID